MRKGGRVHARSTVLSLAPGLGRRQFVLVGIRALSAALRLLDGLGLGHGEALGAGVGAHRWAMLRV